MKKYEKEKLLQALGLEFVITEEQEKKFFEEIYKVLKNEKKKSFHKGARMSRGSLCS